MTGKQVREPAGTGLAFEGFGLWLERRQNRSWCTPTEARMRWKRIIELGKKWALH
jgi:hypothetical protein